MKILFAASEVAPFIKAGGLADVAGSLPKALVREGVQVRVVLPLYEAISDELRAQMQFIGHHFIDLSWRKQYCGVFSLIKDGVTYYFIDNEYYFKRSGIYGHFDDGERFAFFSKAVISLIERVDFRPDIIHANDWQTALVPIYLRLTPEYNDIKTVFSIHNIEYQGRFSQDTLEDLFGLAKSGELLYNGDVNLMKGAIYKSDSITTVSPAYALELKDPGFAHGMHHAIAENAHKLSGILNAIDMSVYDPAKDENLYKPYSQKAPDGKVYNKLEMQKLLGLREDETIPVIACISRLVEHKGFDLILTVLDRIMEENVQFVLLGTGNWKYEHYFLEAQNRYQGRLSANILFSDVLSSRIYAGADIFLMPSKSEPCGLSQMIAMRYGTIPLVRETGGLKDTVFPYPSETANGFTFRDYNAEDMLFVLQKTVALYHEDRDAWRGLMKRGMTADFSWNKSVRQYLDIYKQITE